MTEEQIMIVEGAYLLGFEPTSDDLTDEQLYIEAENYIYLNCITQ